MDRKRLLELAGVDKPTTTVSPKEQRRQRLLELAGVVGISSNMNNPSQEPYTEIPGTDQSPTGAIGTKGYDQLGDDGEGDLLNKLKDEALRGSENPDMAQECCAKILELLRDEDEDVPNGDDNGETNGMPAVDTATQEMG